QWTSLAQSETESFDEYRARVDQLRALLELANENPSARLYKVTLLNRLRPMYEPCILALDAGGSVSDPAAIKWMNVVDFINNHERKVTRANENSAQVQQARTMSPGTRSSGAGSSGGHGGTGRAASGGGLDSPRTSRTGGTSLRDRRYANGECFNCGKKGHRKRDCPEKQVRFNLETEAS